jgi:hypothetical protein
MQANSFPLTRLLTLNTLLFEQQEQVGICAFRRINQLHARLSREERFIGAWLYVLTCN